MDHQDLEIKQYIKNWVDHQLLPVGGREKLIKAAVTHQEKRVKRTCQTAPPIPNEMISWAMVYCIDRKISMARIVA